MTNDTSSARAILVAALLVAAPTLTACKKAPPAPVPAAQQAKADEHGHEHGHGEGEHADEAKLLPDAVQKYGITVQQAQRWVLRPTFTVPARVAFNAEGMAHVGSPLRGRAVEIAVKVGDAVKRGDTLAVIESPELGEAQADLLQRRIAAESAGPAVELARASWERAKTLYDSSQGIALTEVERREADLQAAIAGQKAAGGAADAARNRLSLLGMTSEGIDALIKSGQLSPRFVVRAPIDGQVVEREVTLGELVNADRGSLLVLADMSTLWVIADVPEARLTETAVGATAWVAAATSRERVEAKVTHVGPQLNAQTRTARVRIDVPTGGGTSATIRPGMFAEVEIVATAAGGGEPEPVVAVPEAAVQTVEGGPAVFVPVKGEPGTFAKRAITVGKTVGGLVPVFAGLVEGEEFVATGTFILKAELGKGNAAHEH